MRISNAMQAGFIDEMEKLALYAPPDIDKPEYRLESIAKLIAGQPELPKSPPELHKKPKSKSAGILRNVGTPIVNTARRVAGTASGMVRNLGNTITASSTPIESMKKGLKWTVSTSTQGKGLGRAFNVGTGLVLPAYQAAVGVKNLGKSDEESGGQGRGERLGRLVGGIGGGLIGAPHGFTGGMAGGIGGEYLAGKVGKGVDKAIAKLRRKPQAAPMPQGPVQE